MLARPLTNTMLPICLRRASIRTLQSRYRKVVISQRWSSTADAFISDNEEDHQRVIENAECAAATPMLSYSIQNAVSNLSSRVDGARDCIRIDSNGEREFRLVSNNRLPMVTTPAYRDNTKQTAEWLRDQIIMNKHNMIVLYVGFEAFFDAAFDNLATLADQHNVPIMFSPLVKSSWNFLQNKEHYTNMETITNLEDRLVIHLGASHAMDRLLFQEDDNGALQAAWKDGRLVVCAPELFLTDDTVYRASLSQLVRYVGSNDDTIPPRRQNHKTRVQASEYGILDQEMADAKERVNAATTMEQVFAEFYRLVTKYVERGQLNSPCYWDSGWESFHLYKSVSKALAIDQMRVPWTRLGLINARNAAIGDSLHAFYATAPEAFPIVVCGDTAALLAGGISMINIHTHNRFGVVIIPNNRGMAIEDVISKRSVDGHQYQYDYVKLDRKRDIFTLAQLKEAICNDVMAELRDHLWGVSAHRAEAIVLNIDVQSLRRENADKAPTDAVLLGSSFLDEDFGKRFRALEQPRDQLEAIVDVLHGELNRGVAGSSLQAPVKIQGCSAIEFMEIISQLTITRRDKIQFLPTPTDLLATRTLLPSLVEAEKRIVDSPNRQSNFTNSNGTFSVFVSNSIFGLDGLNNLISTHLEYGTGCLVHLAYDAAETVTHYSQIGQVHRNFGIRPSTILPGLYKNHQGYEGQVLFLNSADNDMIEDLNNGIRNPEVKAILIDMGAPNLTTGLSAE